MNQNQLLEDRLENDMETVRYPTRNELQRALSDAASLAKWLVRFCPPRLPDILKRRTVADFAIRFQLDTFVESGTYLGATVEYLSRYCKFIYSVEYQERLYKRAVERFAARPSIRILHGSGSDLMPLILQEIDRPALFWLDGHFAPGTTTSQEIACPTLAELREILLHRDDHVILIDDADEFNGQAGYPTIGEIEQLVHTLQPAMNVAVRRNIVRITGDTAAHNSQKQVGTRRAGSATTRQPMDIGQ